VSASAGSGRQLRQPQVELDRFAAPILGGETAAKRQNNAAHGVSRGSATTKAEPRRGEKLCDVRRPTSFGASFCRPFGAYTLGGLFPTAYAVGCTIPPLRGFAISDKRQAKLCRSISASVLFRKTSALRAELNSGLRLLFLPRIGAGNDNGIERRSLHGLAG
jgi:hypothetical protein